MNEAEFYDFGYIQEGKASVLVDGQFGSTGKGLLAAFLASQPHNDVDYAVTNASANAGHWTKFANPNKDDFVCFHIPTFGVIQQDARIYLDAGAIIDPDVLNREVEELGIDRKRIYIHPHAAVISEDGKTTERAAECYATAIGSTQKGVGEALSDKIRRDPYAVATMDRRLNDFNVEAVNLNEEMLAGARVSVEVPQGYSLGIDAGFYPYCTSRNCTVAQGLSDAGIAPSALGRVAMSLRTFPIRVGHIYDEDGNKIGDSGPVYPDQHELKWDYFPGVTPEKTTVTGRVRRIFEWSRKQYRDALLENAPDIVFLNFMNYLNRLDEREYFALRAIKDYKRVLDKTPSVLYGYGPNVADVKTSIYGGSYVEKAKA